MLARNLSIRVTILDANTEIDKNPRAAHYAPSAMFEFKRAGILDEVREKGLSPRGICWRLGDTTFLAGMSREPEDTEYAMRVLPLDQLGPLIVRHFESYPNTQILWGHKVVGVKQDENSATAIVETADGERQEITGDYLVGADGASSSVRTALFGKEYPGETLPQQIVATNVGTQLGSAQPKTDILGLPTVRRKIRLLGFEFYRAPDRLVHGCKNHPRRHMASHIRRRRQPLAGRACKTPATTLREDLTWPP
jgi:2-polyprenyl-6-methoxyphenol hydroxylase-like FAD-dependent oxidoreductase